MSTAGADHRRLLSAASRFIRRHLGDRDLGLEAVASELFVSPRQLQRIFKSEIGLTFGQYLFQLRMSVALELLQSDAGRSAREVAERVGYGSGSALAKAMRRHYGKGPHEIRDLQWGTQSEADGGGRLPD